MYLCSLRVFRLLLRSQCSPFFFFFTFLVVIQASRLLSGHSPFQFISFLSPFRSLRPMFFPLPSIRCFFLCRYFFGCVLLSYPYFWCLCVLFFLHIFLYVFFYHCHFISALVEFTSEQCGLFDPSDALSFPHKFTQLICSQHPKKNSRYANVAPTM